MCTLSQTSPICNSKFWKILLHVYISENFEFSCNVNISEILQILLYVDIFDFFEIPICLIFGQKSEILSVSFKIR